MSRVIHLGDGAYAIINKEFVGQIVLTANHHEPEQATDIIHLDINSVRELLRALKSQGYNIEDLV